MTCIFHRRARLVGSAGLLAAAALALPTFTSVGAGSASPPPAPARPAALPGDLAYNGSQNVLIVLKAPCPFSRSRSLPACPAQRPMLAELKAAGARVLGTTTLLDSITASVSASVAQAVARSAGVSAVVPDSPLRSPAASLAPGGALDANSAARAKPLLVAHGVAPASLICGTKADPEVDPQALQDIRAEQARAEGADGAGVTVAVLSDGLNPANPDFIRNAAYGPKGTRVITSYEDFTGQGLDSKSGGAEAFGDASSLAAQGNKEYNLAEYVNPDMASVLPKAGCWVKIVGAAPGASLMVLKVFGQNEMSTTSGTVQAVQYAVQHGAKVINESFGSNVFPDTALDVMREADDAAVAAGVTVVVSSGDAGVTNTIGSPATDPNVISVGATTTFRSYAQSDLGGFYNPVVGNGTWLSDNVSSLSSAGYNQAGGTVDLVAPGDANWAICSTNYKLYTDCSDVFQGQHIGVQNFGGTSEAAPLTAAAAADVIEAYSKAHSGATPSPALVKQILCSTATDIGAPAAEQGAGLLNIAGAVKLAESLPPSPPSTTTTTTTTVPTSAGTTTTTAPGTTGAVAPPTALAAATVTRAKGASGLGSATRITGSLPLAGRPLPPSGALLVSPNQVNIIGPGKATTSQALTLTNTGPAALTVHLSSRALDDKVYDSGAREFTLDPSKPTTNTGTFPIWSGVTEVYQPETFNLPSSHSSRLVFSSDYQNTHQSSVLHVALFEPDGTYAAYSNPQGVADYGEEEVANPPAGRWTALFFTEQNGATKGGTGTKGKVQWDASLWQYKAAGSVTTSELTVPPRGTVTTGLLFTNPAPAGDTDESIVLNYDGGQTTVPVTIRTLVPIGATGGAFKGVLTGGNGRADSAAQANTYFFNVPAGERDLDVSLALKGDPGETLVGFLVAPDGQTVAYSSNYTILPNANSTKLVSGSTRYMQLYHVAPDAGVWELLLQWQNPVTGNELTEPFSGAVRFNDVQASSLLPTSTSQELAQGRTSSFDVEVTNTGLAPEAYFLDPRLDRLTTINLKNISPGTSATRLHLPRRPTANFFIGLPLYLVPAGTSELDASLRRVSGNGTVAFDISPLSGDPDVSPSFTAPSALGSTGTTSASVRLTEPEVSPGLWGLSAAEVGPYPSGGAPKEIVSATLKAVTEAFNTNMHDPTDDLWQVGFKFSKFYYVGPGQSAEIKVQVTPTAAVGTQVTGTVYVDDFTLESFVEARAVLPNSDEVAALPYAYTVSAP